MTQTQASLPRPWYLSISAFWHTADGFDLLQARFNEIGLKDSIPSHQVGIRASAWHSSIFALMKINGWDQAVTAEDFAAEQLSHLVGENPEIVENISKAFSPVEMEAFEVTGFDSGTVLHLMANGSELASFRDAASTILEEPVTRLCETGNNTEMAIKWTAEQNRPLLESITRDPNKNHGSKAFGSLARSPLATDPPFIRWRIPIAPVKLRFSHFYLTFSDESLTNPRAKVGGIRIGNG